MAELMATPEKTVIDQLRTPPGSAATTSAAGAGQVSPIRRDDFDRDIWCLLGIPVDIADIDRAVAEIDAAVRDRHRLSFVTPNVNWLVRALRDDQARREIIEADLSLIDGAPLVAIAKALDIPVKSRVAGSDIFEALRRRPGFGSRRLKTFFFGGRDGAAEAAVKALHQESGGVDAVGWHNPGFGDLDSMSASPVIEKINAADPDFVIVALGAAKGQSWIERNHTALNAPVIAHLGAVVDFTAGGIKRAPAMIQKFGMEWAWRIKEEPALWRRYFNDAMALASISLTRLLPQLLNSAGKPSGEVAESRLVHGAEGAGIRLSGDLVYSNLRGVRDAFRTAANQGGHIRLDFTDVKSIDRSFLGLILMLEKHVTRSGQTLFIDGASASQLAFMKANGMRYPESGAGAVKDTAIGAAGRTAVR